MALGILAGLLTVAPGAGGCSGPQRGEEPAEPVPATSNDVAEADPPPAPAPEIELGPITKGSMREHPAGFAWVFDGASEPTKMHLGEAEARGYTVIDLGDGWVPYIFSEKTPGLDDSLPNGYRQRYLDLAADRTDLDGDPLAAHEHNYLELYGIPPTLTVVQADWDDAEQNVTPCLEEAGFDPSVFEAYGQTIAFKKGQESRFVGPARWGWASLEKAMRKAKLDPQSADDLAAAADHPKTRNAYKAWRKKQGPLDVIKHAQKRFRCEKLYNGNDGLGNFREGHYGGGTAHALAAFEKKHDVMGWGHFTAANQAVLAMTPEEAAHARLIRTIEERTISAAGIVEDGSAPQWKPKFRWKDAEGNEHELRDMVGESLDAVVKALDMETPAAARKSLARLSDLGHNGFETLLVAVKLPERPSYYSNEMQLEAVIDRGDVWYAFPYDEEGNKTAQPRKRYPHLTLYVNHLDQKIPLVHWRTTIGSWRSELKDGDVYYKYKDSDVGPRVWETIMAGPSWIPPDTTPPAELLKRKWVDGAVRTVVNYDEMGPGYKSAYGLVAAYHVKKSYDAEGNLRATLDNQIRTHGSVDYMSILRRYSHGCHRLYNMDAVRLFSFVLRHKEYNRLGRQEVGFRRIIEHEGESHKISIDSRGYKYELVNPVPVMVTKGRIRGSRREPYEDYMKKPGVEYTETPEDSTVDPALDPAATPTLDPGGTPPLTPAPGL